MHVVACLLEVQRHVHTSMFGTASSCCCAQWVPPLISDCEQFPEGVSDLDPQRWSRRQSMRHAPPHMEFPAAPVPGTGRTASARQTYACRL